MEFTWYCRSCFAHNGHDVHRIQLVTSAHWSRAVLEEEGEAGKVFTFSMKLVWTCFKQRRIGDGFIRSVTDVMDVVMHPDPSPGLSTHSPGASTSFWR